MSMDGLIDKKMLYVQKMKYYLPIKDKVTVSINLKSIKLSERVHLQKTTYCMFLFM